LKACIRSLALLVVPITIGAQPIAAQNVEPVNSPLEEFVQQVVRLWSAADVAALVELIPADNRLVLDTGSGIENANSRHAAAALRALFAQSETVGARAVRVTVASTFPARGFGELDWTFRARGAPGEQSRSVYVAAAWQNDSWRITELRLMP
jgi:hypothetical protein